ncbi:MAG: hypothetical protein QM811_25115 [Pirellulales bacterium]
MKFRLSTLFLLTLLIAVGVGWYVDHTNRRRNDIVGTWSAPTRDGSRYGFTRTGYYSSLEIKNDGTFIKTQSGRWQSDVYTGTYECLDDGIVVFRVLSKQIVLEHPLGEASKAETIDREYPCRCAVDRGGHLLINKIPTANMLDNDEIKIRWETHSPTGRS